ncbi:hypothetical protein LOTGIDRAFT_173509 [Lottia gigantea]|uniref:Uncharacterized protein n=1 Tax=Lottia gigantea TaxID=225164 RepID=V4A772_LOTGI|nr:hypothetical protein LOTGIDRAFT_173509 [Lottia gigantea]ESO99793.1 hypothetical protein LOTGIDRAFT_173509 [Lottia gigantea]
MGMRFGTLVPFILWMFPVLDLVTSIPITDGFPRFEYFKRENGYYADTSHQQHSSSRVRATRSGTARTDFGYQSLESHSLEQEKNVITELLRFVEAIDSGERTCRAKERIITLDEFNFPFSSYDYFYEPFEKQVKKTLLLANTLNTLFLYKDKGRVLYDDVFYFALSQSYVENDPKVVGCGIAFAENQYPLRKSSKFWPYAYRGANKPETLVVSDLSNSYNYTFVNWFLVHADKPTVKLHTDKSMLFTNQSNRDIGLVENYVFRRNKTITVTYEDGFWGNPFYDCLLKKWVVSFSLPFYQIKENRDKPIFKQNHKRKTKSKKHTILDHNK